jgi:hypothetical protein
MACTRPLDILDRKAREQHAEEVRHYRRAMASWKAAGSEPEAEPRAPRLARYLVEGATIEALTEVLRDDPEAKQRAPTGKVLSRQDEMSEWLASFDRYRGGGGGGADRGAYLRLFNGGRYTVDRINRGSFAVPNWSACVLGGIQPEPIQRIAREAAEDGLLQRFCYCVPARQQEGEDRQPRREALNRYEALFPALSILHPPTGPGVRAAVLHADAHECRQEIDRLAYAISKMPDTSRRLKAALIFHLIEIADANSCGAPQVPVGLVTEATARRVSGYMRDILLPHLVRADAVMFSTAQTGHARWIAGFVLAQGQARVTVRDVMRAYSPLRAPEQRRELLEVMLSLENVGWLCAEPQDNPARSTTAWEVNPKVHARFASRAERERADRRAAQQATAEAIARAQGGRP